MKTEVKLSEEAGVKQSVTGGRAYCHHADREESSPRPARRPARRHHQKTEISNPNSDSVASSTLALVAEVSNLVVAVFDPRVTKYNFGFCFL
jgi:hypothetical protein